MRDPQTQRAVGGWPEGNEGVVGGQRQREENGDNCNSISNKNKAKKSKDTTHKMGENI